MTTPNDSSARTSSAASAKAPRGARRLLMGAAFLRATTTSVIGIVLGVHLGRLGLAGRDLGLIVSAGLAGGAVAAVLATYFADRVGRRRFLLGLTALNVLGTLAFAWSTHPVALAAAAFIGMLNGMGRDRGAALIVEQAALPSTAGDTERTRVIAVYTMLQDLGHALGAVLVGALGWIAAEMAVRASGTGSASASALIASVHRGTFIACAIASLLGFLLYLALGAAVEAGAKASHQRVSPRSVRIVSRIAGLFAIDSVAGGFLTTAMLSYFFFERFGVDERVIGALFFGARLMNALSHLGAAWLAERIGLVNTMVFTHIPSSLLLMTVAFAPSFAVAALLFLLREGLVEMDVPTRQSYVLAVVEPHERTFASGVTNLVRLAGWAIAPAFAGLVIPSSSLHLQLVVGATMKIAYDLLLWRAFHDVRPPEEHVSPKPTDET